jgi:hypothetical protein
MQLPERAWRFSVQDSNRYELLDEAYVAQMIEGEQINLVDAVRTGDAFILAMGDCARCEGACRLWFMSESESPAHVCPYLIYFADFGAKARRGALEEAVS